MNALAEQALFAGYSPDEKLYDEMFTAPGVLRPHWERFAQLMGGIGSEELGRRWDQVERLVRENGILYNAYGDPEDVARPWDLDALALLIAPDEWKQLSQALVQRARLLNLVLADLYGPQTLITDGSLPAKWLFSHPGFTRPFHGQRLPHDRYLHLYAADLARSPDGRWWVVGDRSDAPLGIGYALENRIVASRLLPGIIRDSHIERLAPFFLSLREMLQRLAPEHRENPRIVLLSQGPTGPNYFEDAYLARYLGYTLVEAGDLAIRDNHVYLKTLGGLLHVDVLFRRQSDQLCDPLECRGDASLGIPGLLQAARMGHVAIANALGSSLVESPSLMPFLPRLSQRLLGEELLMPSVATWWCGDEDARQHVLANLDTSLLRSAYRLGRREPVTAEDIARKTPEQLRAEIAARPEMFVAQEQIERSTVPVWQRTGPLRRCRVAMRTFVVATGDAYTVLPGGLVRISSDVHRLDLSILAGEGSKDAWVVAEAPVQKVTLLRPPGQAIALRRSGAELPSRVADNLFWLGRQVERAAAAARLLRPTLLRLTSEAGAATLPELTALLRCLAAQGQIEPGFVVEGIREQLPAIEKALPEAVMDESQSGSLASTIRAVYQFASLVRDRTSIDSWRIVYGIDQQRAALATRKPVELNDMLEFSNRLIRELAAFDGLVGESMTRTQAWRFLDLGRRLERALQIIALVQNGIFHGPVEAAVLEAVLEVADSIMTYRSRYLATMQLAPVLDLLLTDESNPRSLVYQLRAVVDHVEQLPRDGGQSLRSAEQRTAMSALHSLHMIDLESLEERPGGNDRTRIDRLLSRLSDQLPRLSETISNRYLIHASVPKPLADVRAETADRLDVMRPGEWK